MKEIDLVDSLFRNDLEKYLTFIYQDLIIKQGTKENIGITILTFSTFIKVPIFIGDKILHSISKKDNLNENEFILLIKNLYFADFETKKDLIFNIVDFDKNGTVKKENITLFYFHLNHNNEVKNETEINKIFGNNNILGYLQFMNRMTNNNYLYTELERLIKEKCPINTNFILVDKKRKIKFEDILETSYQDNTYNFSKTLSTLPFSISDKDDNTFYPSFYSKQQNPEPESILLENSNYFMEKQYNTNDAFEEKKFTNSENYSYIIHEGKIKFVFLQITQHDILFYENESKKSLFKIFNLSNCYFLVKGDLNKHQNFEYSITLKFLAHEFTIYNPSQQIYSKISSCLKELLPKNNEMYEKYEILTDISITHYGFIKLIRQKSNKKLFIAKIIHKKKLSLKEHKLAKSEIDITKVCKHQNVILCEDVIEDFDYIYIIMEYMQCGDLENFISKFEEKVNQTIKRKIIIQIIKGVEYLHSHGIIHRDLKPENILLMDHNNEIIIKIADFGLSTVLSEFEKTNEGYGTIGYVAPEVLTRTPYNHKIDIWSMGVIIYYIISGELPFNNSEDEEKIAKSTVLDNLEFDELIWKNQPIELIEFICGCLEKDPRNRLSFKDLMCFCFSFLEKN